MKYRCKIEVIADMLSAAQERTKKTHIMYRGNLSFKVLNVYLSAITKANLVSFDDATECYLITEKGKLFLDIFKNYKRLANILEKQYNSVTTKRTLLEHMCSVTDFRNKNGLTGDHDRIATRAT
jgi:predicted transcriptional regulator